jgi:flagellar motor protein MotB
MARKKAPEPHANHERWLVSYADFVTLLFAFFVVMFATSRSDVDKRKAYASGYLGAIQSFGVFQPGAPSPTLDLENPSGAPTNIIVTVEGEPIVAGGGDTKVEGDADYTSESEQEAPEVEITAPESETSTEAEQPPDVPSPVQTPSFDEPTSEPTKSENALPTPDESGKGPVTSLFEGPTAMTQLFTQLQTMLKNEITSDRISMHQDKRGIVISLSEAGFFDSGSADLKRNSLETVDIIASQIKRLGKDVMIRIEGHTDNVPLSPGSRYRSNRELSTARANVVVDHLVDERKFSPINLISSGYGEFRPVAPNNTAEGRGRNRRVDIVILNDEYAELEAPKQIK